MSAVLPSCHVALDAGQYSTLWRHLGLGEKPMVLDTPDHGATYAARDAEDGAAWARLVAAGLVDTAQRVRPEVSDALVVLQRPERELDVRMRTPRGRTLWTAATRGELGVVAALDAARGLRLRLHPGARAPADLASALLHDVPLLPALAGVALRVPAGARGADAAQRRRSLRSLGVPRATAERVQALWSQPPERAMTFGGAWRERAGRRRHPEVLAVLDTVGGRVEARRVGEEVELRPLDARRLHAAVARLAASPS